MNRIFGGPCRIYKSSINILNLKYKGDWNSGENADGSRTKMISFPTPEYLQNNGSIYLHVFMVKNGMSPVPNDQHYSGREVIRLKDFLF